MKPLTRLRSIPRRPVLVGIALMLVAAATTTAFHPWSRHPAAKRLTITSEEPTPTPTVDADPSPPGSPSPSPSATASEPDTDKEASPEIHHDHPSVSRGGAVVAFTVRDAGYPPRQVSNVYVRSRSSHRTSLISRGSDDEPADGDSDNAAVCADGTKVAFVSAATNLVPGDTNGALDVFVRDLVAHTTVRVSVSSTGTQGKGPSGTAPMNGWTLGRGVPAISADGRYVAFESSASNLVASDTNGRADVFVHDLKTGETVAVSVSGDGQTGNAASGFPSIAADGRTIAFESEATDLTQDVRPADTLSGVFVRDMDAGKTALASVSSTGEWLGEWNGSPSLAGSGRVVAFINVPDVFESDQHDEIIDEGGDIVRRDLVAGTTTSVNPEINTYHMKRVVLSGDGTVTAFTHLIGGMDPFCYLLPGEHRGGYLGSCDRMWLSVSPDGRYIGFGAAMDALSDPDDEKRFGGDFGAMIYDRVADEFVAAWKW